MRSALITTISATAALALAPGAMAAGCPDADAPVDSVSQSAFADSVGCLVNVERAKAGLPAHTREARLDRAAQAHSQDMAARGYFDHFTPEGRGLAERIAAVGYTARYASENIARGASTPATVVQTWMQSAGHRANILSSRNSQMGVGVVSERLYTLEMANPGLLKAIGKMRGTFAMDAGTLVFRGKVPNARAGEKVLVTAKRGSHRVTRKVTSGNGGVFAARLPIGEGAGAIQLSAKVLSTGAVETFTFRTRQTVR